MRNMRKKIACLAIVALFLPASAAPSIAQSIGYAQAIDRLGAACGKDIDKLCKKANLGGGRVTQCLNQNQAAVSSGCKASVAEMTAMLTTRAQARAAVLRVCDVDIKRLCAGIQPGDGNLMECFYKARQNMSPSCQTAVANAGYDAPVNASAATTQVALGSTDLIFAAGGGILAHPGGPAAGVASIRDAWSAAVSAKTVRASR